MTHVKADTIAHLHKNKKNFHQLFNKINEQIRNSIYGVNMP